LSNTDCVGCGCSSSGSLTSGSNWIREALLEVSNTVGVGCLCLAVLEVGCSLSNVALLGGSDLGVVKVGC
jgi:hypothetical protein